MYRFLGVLILAATIAGAVWLWRRRKRRWLEISGAIFGVIIGLLSLFAVPTLLGKPWVIEHLYARYFFHFMLDHPSLLTRLRILEPMGFSGHNAELDDYSVAFIEHERRRDRDYVDLLHSYDRSSLDDTLSYDILLEFVGNQDERDKFAFHDFPVNQTHGVHQDIADVLLKHHQLDTREGAEHYVERVHQVLPTMNALVEALKHRQSRKLVPPRVVVDKSAAQIRELVVTPATASPFYTHFANKSYDDLNDAVAAAIEASLNPGFSALADYLEALSPDAGDDSGVWQLPDGDSYYVHMLRRRTTTDYGPDKIHALGLEEVARIEKEIVTILEAEGYTVSPEEGTLGDKLRAIAAEPRFKYEDSQAGRDKIVADYTAMIAEVKKLTAPYFSSFPKADVVVEPSPKHKEKGGPFAYYNGPPMDGSRPGIFYVNLAQLDEFFAFGMKTLAAHEAIPGHHHQVALAREMKDMPMYRKLVPFSAYSEGWALYAEQLADEAGFYDDPYSRTGYLMAQLFRAARLVVDTGLHHKRWSREQAIDYMKAHTGRPLSDCENEVERYMVWPGQATGYKVGQLFILELRQRAKEKLGKKFDLKAFHDVVLGGGGLPLTLLGQEVDAWIAQKS